MSQIIYPAGTASSLWVVVQPEPSGQFVARVVGLPELHATAANAEEAVQQIRHTLAEWLASGKLVAIDVPTMNRLLQFRSRDPNDPLEQEYLQDLARFRQEDLERTLREYEQEDRECSDSSSTPTT